MGDTRGPLSNVRRKTRLGRQIAYGRGAKSAAVNASAPEFKNFAGSEEMVLKLNDLSLATHAKVQDMFE